MAQTLAPEAAVPGALALERLLEGNRAYLAGEGPNPPSGAEIARLDTRGQRPWAVVVGCADSRVPPELVFCQGVGRLFTVRTAGNVVSALELGSVEYAVTHLGVRLVLVLGHSGCGAVAGALAGGAAGCLGQVLAEIAPCAARARRRAASPEQAAALAEDENIRHSLDRLRADAVLRAVPDLVFAAAKYDTHTGRVALLEER